MILFICFLLSKPTKGFIFYHKLFRMDLIAMYILAKLQSRFKYLSDCFKLLFSECNISFRVSLQMGFSFYSNPFWMDIVSMYAISLAYIAIILLRTYLVVFLLSK